MPDKNPQIFVTGGTGLVGSHLLRQLLAKGYTQIRALKRPKSPMGLVKDIEDRIEWIEGDILNIFQLDDAMQNVDIVFHSAAVISLDPKAEAMMKKVNVEGTANMVDAALNATITQFIHISSIAAIGRRRDGEQISERSKWERNPLNSTYAITKYQAEQEVWRGMVEGLQVAVLNPAVILGIGFWEKGTSQLFSKVWNGLHFYPIGGTAFVDADDVARLCIQLMVKEVSGQRVIAAAENRSYKEFFSTIATHLGKKPPTIKTPPWLATVGAHVVSFASRLISRPSPLSLSTAKLTANTFYYDNHLSKELFQFDYTPLDQTIEKCSLALRQSKKTSSSSTR